MPGRTTPEPVKSEAVKLEIIKPEVAESEVNASGAAVGAEDDSGGAAASAEGGPGGIAEVAAEGDAGGASAPVESKEEDDATSKSSSNRGAGGARAPIGESKSDGGGEEVAAGSGATPAKAKAPAVVTWEVLMGVSDMLHRIFPSHVLRKQGDGEVAWHAERPKRYFDPFRDCTRTSRQVVLRPAAPRQRSKTPRLGTHSRRRTPAPRQKAALGSESSPEVECPRPSPIAPPRAPPQAKATQGAPAAAAAAPKMAAKTSTKKRVPKKRATKKRAAKKRAPPRGRAAGAAANPPRGRAGAVAAPERGPAGPAAPPPHGRVASSAPDPRRRAAGASAPGIGGDGLPAPPPPPPPPAAPLPFHRAGGTPVRGEPSRSGDGRAGASLEPFFWGGGPAGASREPFHYGAGAAARSGRPGPYPKATARLAPPRSPDASDKEEPRTASEPGVITKMEEIWEEGARVTLVKYRGATGKKWNGVDAEVLAPTMLKNRPPETVPIKYFEGGRARYAYVDPSHLELSRGAASPVV